MPVSTTNEMKTGSAVKVDPYSFTRALCPTAALSSDKDVSTTWLYTGRLHLCWLVIAAILRSVFRVVQWWFCCAELAACELVVVVSYHLISQDTVQFWPSLSNRMVHPLHQPNMSSWSRHRAKPKSTSDMHWHEKYPHLLLVEPVLPNGDSFAF